MAADEPPYLTVGTDVSAKYKGAFCEAKIKKVNRVVKCKVTFKNNLGAYMITDDQIKGPLRIGADIEAKHPEKNQFFEAVINKLQDYSQYTVVFDDGDETTLRRTSLCLKSGRHFAESPTLDQFPLTNPEHFGTPVIGAGKYKRKRRSTMNSSLDYGSSDEDSLPRKLKAIRGKERDPDLGKVVCVDYGDRRKKDSWYPGLIVPHPAQSNIKISKEEHLIRSFKDGKYYQVPKKDTREFNREIAMKVDNNTLRTAVEKAVLYLEKEELPPHWDKALFQGLDFPSADEDSHDSDSDSSDDEPSEEKDRFVAQLYKFMDERGTPINKAPTVSNRDLNLYKLFKIMHKLGGYNKVTNKNKWKAVYSKMNLPQSNLNGPNQIKFAYKRYLQSFEDFYRKLGCTMVTNSRSTRGRHRSDRNFIITRTRDRDTASPKGRNTKDFKDKVLNEKKTDEKVKGAEKKESKSEENLKLEDKPKSPEKKKLERLRSDDKDKDDKRKREEKPRLVRTPSLIKDKKENSAKEEEKKDPKPEKARTREDARKEKNESPEKKGTRLSSKMELERKEREEAQKDKKERSPKEKKEEKTPKESKEEKNKDKKEEKTIKERKVLKEKKVEEKTVKDKRENPVREKREDRSVKDKRDSSKEPKEEKTPKGKKEDIKSPEEKSPLKKKLERLAKEKKEEKVVRPRREDKSPSVDVSKKPVEDIEAKIMKEEKVLRVEIEIKKEDAVVKDKLKPKLREKREDTPLSEDGHEIVDLDVCEDKESMSLDGFEKRGPGPRLRGDDTDESLNKGKRRSLKDDRDEKDSIIGLSDSDDESFTNDSEKAYNKDVKHNEIEVGDRVKVKYGRGRMQKVYEAKVLKVEMDGPDKRFYVHYAGWNMRYDEWVRKNYIVAVINSSKQKSEMNSKNSAPSPNLKKIDRGRPPGAFANMKPARKNSTSSTNSSLSCPRSTRSDKKSLQTSPLSSGLEPRKRIRKKSSVAFGLTDTSQESESDGEDGMDLDDEDVDEGEADVEDNSAAPTDCCFKEELFSDDEEKEKLEDVKRGDITELEKAISVEENADDIKDSFFSSVCKKNDIPEEKPVLKKETSEEIKLDIVPEIEHPVVPKVEKDTCEISFRMGHGISGSIDTSIKLSSPVLEIEKKTIAVETPSNPVTKRTYSDIIKPAKIIFPSVSSASSDNKLDKSPVFSHILSNPLPTSSTSVADYMTKNIYESSVPPLTEHKTTLSFAGLHGLIQKSAFEKSVIPEKGPPKICMVDSVDKVEPCIDSVPNSSNIEEKTNTESKSALDTLRPEKVTSVFSSSTMLSNPQTCESIKSEESYACKNIGNIYSCIVKPDTAKVAPDNVKHSFEGDTNIKVISEDKNSGVQKDEKLKCPDNKTNLLETTNISAVKPSILSPAKLSAVNNDTFEKKSKDSFDLLAPGNNSFTQEQKKTLVKDNIFSLSFSASKDKFMLDQPYNKLLAGENLCRIKPKPSETVDLSKTIPGIIERLKKDVVADLKITDSPPPQKEELNFDFLRGSQDPVKSLSRSDSSNSLRICEDLSDTNDSNTDSKDLIISDKFDASNALPVSNSENLLPVVREHSPDKISEVIYGSVTSVKADDTSSFTKKEDLNNSQKTSVITVVTSSVTNETLPVTPEIKGIKKDILQSEVTAVASKCDEHKTDVPVSEADTLSKEECKLTVDTALAMENCENSLSVAEVGDKVSEVPEAINDKVKISSNVSENKDSLFDDLLKIRNSSSNFNHSSVIMRVPENPKIMPSNSGELSPVEEKGNNKQEDLVLSNAVSDEFSFKEESCVHLERMDRVEKITLDKQKDDYLTTSTVSENKSSSDDNVIPEDDVNFSHQSKKEGKKKKLGKKLGKKVCGLDGYEKEEKDFKVRDGKSKSKKRVRLENEEADKGKDCDLKSKSKKLKKNKNKKRFPKHDDQFAEYDKKMESKDDDHKDFTLDKMKRKEKRKSDKKFLKSGMKSDEFSDTKVELPKKKKGKKNRDKLGNDRKDFSEKKTKKKRKPHIEDNQDSDSDKETVTKLIDKKKKKERKKFKVKDCSSSDDATDKFFKEQNKDLSTVPIAADAVLRQDSKSDDPDMSFLLCEEKVPASPVGISNIADDTSGSSSIDGSRVNSEIERLPLPNVYPCIDNLESSDTINKHSIDTSAVLDNTPPTTPSSTESLLSSSPSHERDSFSMNYPESTQSGRESCEGESEIYRCNSNRTVMRGSEEYRAATTLAFAVCKTVNEKPKDNISHVFLKRQKSETDDHTPSKRKKKSKRIRRCSESAKSPRHKSSLPRMSKVESCCEDSSGASPATSNSPPYGSTSTLSFTRSSPHRLSCVSDGMSRYNFYVPLHDKDPEKRIALLQEKMAELRQQYMALRAKVIAIDHKRRKARKKVREAGAAVTNPAVQSEDGQSCS